MSVTWTGLESFKHALKNLPAELTGEASNIVIEAAKTAERDTKAAYPHVTGSLIRGVTTNVEAINRGGVSARVKSGARHAHLFEGGYRGTAPRRDVPENQKFVPIAIRARRQMVAKLIHMVQAAGLIVTNE